MVFKHVFGECKRGISMATASLVLIWYDLFLIAFIAVPLILTVLTDLVAYNVLLSNNEVGLLNIFGFNQLINEFLRGPHWMHVIAGIFFLFIKVLIGTFCMGALVVYSAGELKGKMLSFTRSFAHLKTHWVSLVWWAIIGTIENVILQSLLSADYELALRLCAVGIASLWYMATWLVLPLIILQHNGVRRAILSSFLLVREQVWIIGSGVLWLLAFSVGPNFVLNVFDYFTAQFAAGSVLVIVTIILLIALRSYILTAETLFKTMIYQKVYQK
jgi:hypothetical protein